MLCRIWKMHRNSRMLWDIRCVPELEICQKYVFRHGSTTPTISQFSEKKCFTAHTAHTGVFDVCKTNNFTVITCLSVELYCSELQWHADRRARTNMKTTHIYS